MTIKKRGVRLDDEELRRQLRIGRCLLYTSDAADERSSVDLGGRRIIKKKKSCDDKEDTRHQSTVEPHVTLVQ